jgi:hypothetical protein
MPETITKNQTKKKIKIHPVSLIVEILIGYALILGISFLIEPHVSPHFPMLFGSDPIENALAIASIIASMLCVLYLFIRYPSIPLFLIAAAITLIAGLIIVALVIGGVALSPIAILGWAVIFALMKPNRSE